MPYASTHRIAGPLLVTSAGPLPLLLPLLHVSFVFQSNIIKESRGCYSPNYSLIENHLQPICPPNIPFLRFGASQARIFKGGFNNWRKHLSKETTQHPRLISWLDTIVWECKSPQLIILRSFPEMLPNMKPKKTQEHKYTGTKLAE